MGATIRVAYINVYVKVSVWLTFTLMLEISGIVAKAPSRVKQGETADYFWLKGFNCRKKGYKMGEKTHVSISSGHPSKCKWKVQAMRQKKKENFIFFLVFLFFAGMMVVSYYWSGDRLYKDAYRNPVHENKQRVEGERPATVEPKPAGFSEHDIEKQRGRRYATF